MISMFCLLQVCDFQFCVLYTEEGVSDCTRQLSKEPIRQGVRPAPMLDVSSRVSSPNMGAKFILVDSSDRAAVPSVRSYFGLKQKLWHEQSTTLYWMFFVKLVLPIWKVFSSWPIHVTILSFEHSTRSPCWMTFLWLALPTWGLFPSWSSGFLGFYVICAKSSWIPLFFSVL